jgi:hypothetical protein
VSELSYKAKNSLDKAEAAITELRSEVLRLEMALDEQTGVVQPLLPYPVYEITQRTHMKSTYRTPAQAREAVEHAYQQSLPIVEQNKAIIASNKRIVVRLKQFVENAKINTTMQVKNDSRARWASRTKTVTADWFTGLQAAIPTGDSWGICEDGYQRRLKEIEQWEKEIQAEEAKVAAARKAEEDKLDREIIRRELAKKYGLEEATTLDDVFSALLDRNKYLRLAHYLSKNRADWSEGPWYAKTGINGFKVETDEDHEIHKELSGFIVDWDGDGRIFRDCTWSYDRLFSKAGEQDEGLLADYRRVRESLPDEF